jgi:hypothetical protein
MQVTLDIFSGRPNPSWTLNPAEAKELVQRLVGLPPARQPPPSVGLGYRGFLITNPQEEGGLPGEIRACRGAIISRTKEGVARFDDVNQLEAWLAEQARKHGYGRLVDAVPGLRHAGD